MSDKNPKENENQNNQTQEKRKVRNNRKSHDEEDCQDKACSETKSSFKKWMHMNQKTTQEDDCPLDKETLGRNTWSLLHTMAATYPKQPSKDDQANMGEFIRLMSILYPCSYCAKEFRQDLKELPPRVSSRKELSTWFCEIHNRVNKKLHKPQFDCSKVEERWRTGWKDGRCF